MRTKTLALSAVLGMLGSASVMAANVYSVNAVGYINVTMPPGFSVITCPLICGAEGTATNDLNIVLPNPAATAPYAGALVYQMTSGSYTATEQANPVSYGGGWVNGGADITLIPGRAVFFQNPNALGGANMTATFVGTVPQGTLTNPLIPGFNLVGSMVPYSGDLVTGAIPNISTVDGAYPAAQGDFIYFFNPAQAGPYQIGFQADLYSYGAWFGATSPYVGAAPNYHPTTVSATQGFFYYNNTAANGPAATENWVETFSINP